MNRTESNRKRAAAYCRVSTSSDLQDGSFDTQCAYYRRRIGEDPEMELVDVYGDHGKSGRSMSGRPELQRLLRDCGKGRVDLILTKSMSRFARNLAECVETIRQLQTMGIPIYFEKEGLKTGDPNSELFLCILATVAQEESHSISMHVSWSRREMALAGRPVAPVAYGYRGGRENGHLWRVEESEARRVRRAFELANQGVCYREIRETLQAMETEEKTQKIWSQYNLGYMLHNSNYTGDYLVHKTCEIETAEGRKRIKNRGQAVQILIEGHHTPLVSRAVFERVQELMAAGLLNSSKRHFTQRELKLLEAVV